MGKMQTLKDQIGDLQQSLAAARVNIRRLSNEIEVKGRKVAKLAIELEEIKEALKEAQNKEAA